MIKVRRKSFTLSPKTFQVRYLGSTLTPEPGLAGIQKAVSIIHSDVKATDKTCPKMSLEVTADGIRFKQEGRCQESKFIPLRSISYGTMNKENTNIFAFNHHVSRQPFVVECHAVVCEKEEIAKEIGIALYAAFRGGHFDKLRKERRRSKERHQSQEKNSRSELPDSAERLSLKSSSSQGSTSSRGSSDAEDYMSLTVDVGYEEQELDNIVQDILSTVEREKALME